jgi:hemerythrin-like domain-containing protein
MVPSSIQIIRDEHSSLAAMLRSFGMLVERGPGRDPQNFFATLSAMLFYVDEFPERLHHPKESELLFPPVALRAPETAELIARLDREHERGESEVRKLTHLLQAWELIGESRRQAFEVASQRYLAFYLEHMRLEETVIIPAAMKVLTESDWKELDAAFASNCDPFTGTTPRDPAYDRLYTRIVSMAPAPIGLG